MPAVKEGKIAILGAGGGVGACLWEELRDDYTLRFADLRPFTDFFVENPAPDEIYPIWHEKPTAPHEWRRFDVTNYQQVREMIDGCDAVINLTVNRADLATAFRVNVVGAWNILRAAVDVGVRRVIHTGVWMRVNGFEGDYRYEYALPDDVPPRAGTRIYPHTKSLGIDVVDAFAQESGLDVMTFLLSRLRPAEAHDQRDENVLIPFSVSFPDLARAYRKGLEAPTLPRPNERFFICAPLPLDKYLTEKTQRLLGWTAQDTFERFHTRENGIPSFED